MTEDELTSLVDSRTGWMALTTIGRDGFPHTVPIGYFRLEGNFYLGCRAGTRKVFNIEHNPKVSLMLAAGRSERDIKGVMVQGLASIVADDSDRLRLSQAGARMRGVAVLELPREASLGSVYIEVKPQKI
jgi:general stress protein 26